MPDAVTTNTIIDGEKRLVLNLLNASDGTGESAVIKANASTYTGPNKPDATTHFIVEWIEYDIQGFSHVDLYFDAATDDALAKLSGQGFKDYRDEGGLADPQSTTWTGDIKLTTVGATATSTYDITVSLRKKN